MECKYCVLKFRDKWTGEPMVFCAVRANATAKDCATCGYCRPCEKDGTISAKGNPT